MATAKAKTPGFGMNGNYDVPAAGFGDSFRLYRFRSVDALVNKQGQPTAKFQLDYQRNVELTEAAVNRLIGDVTTLQEIVDRLVAAEKAAGAAQVAVEQAQTQVAQQADMQRVRDSYSDPGVITASNVGGSVTVTVAAHTRHYIDPAEAKSVGGGTITGQPAATTLYVFYDDPTLAGGAVTYQATTDSSLAFATTSNPYRHTVGTISSSPATTGGGTVGESTRPYWKAGLEPQEVAI